MAQVVGFEPRRARDIAKATLMVLNKHGRLPPQLTLTEGEPEEQLAPIRGTPVTSLQDNRR